MYNVCLKSQLQDDRKKRSLSLKKKKFQFLAENITTTRIVYFHHIMIKIGLHRTSHSARPFESLFCRSSICFLWIKN